MKKHEIINNLHPDLYIKTNTSVREIYKLAGKKFSNTVYSGGFAFIHVANYLQKNIPFLINEPDNYLNKLYFNHVFKDGKYYRYDLKRAYLTVLSPFLSKEKINEYQSKNKAALNVACGYLYSTKTVVDARTFEVLEVHPAKRPDILIYLSKALYRFSRAVKTMFENTFKMQILDGFFFTESVNVDTLTTMLKSAILDTITETSPEAQKNANFKNVNIIWHFDEMQAESHPDFVKMKSEKEEKIYFRTNV